MKDMHQYFNTQPKQQPDPDSSKTPKSKISKNRTASVVTFEERSLVEQDAPPGGVAEVRSDPEQKSYGHHYPSANDSYADLSPVAALSPTANMSTGKLLEKQPSSAIIPTTPASIAKESKTSVMACEAVLVQSVTRE